MPNIELCAPVDLMAARIRRINRSINKETAGKLVAELNDIIACVQSHYAAHPHPRGRATVEFEEIDVIETLRRTVVDIWPSDLDESSNEGIWIMERLTDIDDELYMRYLRLCDRINGTDLAEWAMSAPPAL